MTPSAEGLGEQAAEQAEVVGLAAGVDVAERSGREGVDLARAPRAPAAAYRGVDEPGSRELVEVEAHGRHVQADLVTELRRGHGRVTGTLGRVGQRVDQPSPHRGRQQRRGVGLDVGGRHRASSADMEECFLSTGTHRNRPA